MGKSKPKSKRASGRSAKSKASLRKPADGRGATEPIHSDEHGIEFIARGCLVERSSVLLCRNLKHGYLYLPGGHVDFGESAAEALAREFVEECGLRVRVAGLALASEGAFSTKKHRHHEINLVFHVERSAGGDGDTGRLPVVKSREPGIGFEWVELAAVVDRDIRPTSAKAWLASLDVSGKAEVEWVSEFGA